MPAGASTTVQRQRLGLRLRRLREAAKLTTEQVAESMACSDSKISRIETGHVTVTPADLRHLLDLYGVTGGELREGLIDIAKETRRRGRWREFRDVPIVPEFMDLEVAADSIRTYAALLVPGLLQTPGYARAVIGAVRPELSGPELDRRVTLRMQRQEILARPHPPTVRAVLDEAVLRRPIGGRKVMREQLVQLLDLAARAHVTLQVLPFSKGQHAGLDGQFIILGFPGAVAADMVYFDNVTSDLYLESSEVSRYPQIFARLAAAALDPGRSTAFLKRLLAGDTQRPAGPRRQPQARRTPRTGSGPL